jgi:hypothetical protein
MSEYDGDGTPQTVPTWSHPVPEATGDESVDQAMRDLALAATRPLDEQVAAFDAVHQSLQDRLADDDG